MPDVADSNVPLTIDEVKGKMDMTDDWFQKASYGKLSINKDVNGDGSYDVYRIKLDDYSKATDGCSASKLRDKSLAKLTFMGIDVSLYKYRVIVMPPLGCGWGGLGNVGCGTSCTSWIHGVNWNLVYPHELGHNLTLRHSSTDPENNGTKNVEYGDGSCPMGNKLSKGHFNSANTVRMGWLKGTDGQVSDISNKSGNYSLPPMSDGGKKILIYRINKDKNYFLSYRTPTAFDQIKTEYSGGLSFHSKNGNSNSLFVKTLKPGEQIITADFTLKVTGINNGKVEFTYAQKDEKPIVSAGDDQTISLPTRKVTLTGTAKDSVGYITESTWSQISGPTVVLRGKQKSFDWNHSLAVDNLQLGTYVFRFSATNYQGNSASDDVSIFVVGNQKPVVDAGGDITIVLPKKDAVLKGKCTDSDGKCVKATWKILNKNLRSGMNFSEAISTDLYLDGLEKGTYSFRLVGEDDKGATASDDVTLTVREAPQSFLR